MLLQFQIFNPIIYVELFKWKKKNYIQFPVAQIGADSISSIKLVGFIFYGKLPK